MTALVITSHEALRKGSTERLVEEKEGAEPVTWSFKFRFTNEYTILYNHITIILALNIVRRLAMWTSNLNQHNLKKFVFEFRLEPWPLNFIILTWSSKFYIIFLIKMNI